MNKASQAAASFFHGLEERLHNAFFLAKLKRSSFAPAYLEGQRFGSLFIFNLSHTIPLPSATSSRLASGMDVRPGLALAKALSEYVERVAFLLLWQQSTPLSGESSSDGFAALPRLRWVKNHRQQVREISLAESIERLCWPRFWSDPHVAFTTEALSPASTALLASCPQLYGAQHIFPRIASKYHLCISMVRIGSQGVVLGGGCHLHKNQAIFKSLQEVIRHYFANLNIKNGFYSPTSLYQRRLHYLGQYGFSAYKDRLALQGKAVIKLPRLRHDREVEHPFIDNYVVFRTRFSGQGAFIDDDETLGYV